MTIPRKIFWTSLGSALVAVATTFALMFWIAAQTDRIAADETLKRVDHVLDSMTENLALITQDYAHWSSAYNWYRDGDDTALYDNLGSGASDSDSFDLILLTAADGTPTHAYGPDYFASDLGFVEPGILNTALPLIVSTPIEDAAIARGFVSLDGELAIVAVARIQPDDIGGLVKADLPLFVGVRWLDPWAFGQDQLLSGMTQIDNGDPVAPGLSARPLTDMTGRPIGLLAWQSPQPGQTLLRTAIPAVTFLALFLFIGSWVAGKTAARQAADYMREHQTARTDAMTGVLNRKGLDDVVTSQRVEMALEQGAAALIYVDMNELKATNDSMGHSAGDAAITITAKRLHASVRTQDYVARIGGDEFVCLIIGDDPVQAAGVIADRFMFKSERPFRTGTVSLKTKSSIGIAIASPGLSWDSLLAQADDAMYQAKKTRSPRPFISQTPNLAAS